MLPRYETLLTNVFTQRKGIDRPDQEDNKTFFMLNSAKHEIFSANKYENANY